MNLTYSQIKECTLGAEFALETELGLTLYRFNEEELEMFIYEVLNPIGYNYMVTPKEIDFVINPTIL